MITLTPPMGWNSWNTFGHDISEELVKTTADTMAENGLLDAGYNYLVIDDCWAEFKRDEKTHKLVPSKEKFPNGIKAVADYVHSKGLKFGIYSCSGTLTCAGYPSSFEYEFIDAKTFAEWGVDFLKYDYCYKPSTVSGDLLYKRMGMALANCGRDILFSACSWGYDDTHKWIKSTGANMWRSTGDIFDNWNSIKALYQQQIELQSFNGQGCSNDMDMLIVGMHGKGNVGLGGCSDVEYRTHFSMWSFFNSPLMIGCDIRSMTEETKNILTKKEIIAINQDPAQRQPYKANNSDACPAWVKLLSNGDLAVAIFNLTENTQSPNFIFTDIGLNRSCGIQLEITDLWKGKKLGTYRDMFRYNGLAPHDCLMLRCKLINE